MNARISSDAAVISDVCPGQVNSAAAPDRLNTRRRRNRHAGAAQLRETPTQAAVELSYIVRPPIMRAHRDPRTRHPARPV